eukprot:793010-Amphidinium_carterae.1
MGGSVFPFPAKLKRRCPKIPLASASVLWLPRQSWFDAIGLTAVQIQRVLTTLWACHAPHRHGYSMQIGSCPQESGIRGPRCVQRQQRKVAQQIRARR